jgi:hypothetical protein
LVILEKVGINESKKKNNANIIYIKNNAISLELASWVDLSIFPLLLLMLGYYVTANIETVIALDGV